MDIPTRTRRPSTPNGSEMSVPRTGTNNPMPLSESTLPKEPSTKERVDPTSSATSVPGDHEFPKESPPRRVSEQSVLQPHTFKHRKPITDYVSLKWERDGTLKDYVHRKDPVNCEQCTLNTHPESEDKNIGDIVLRYSQYQKGDTKLDAPSSSTNGTTNDTTNNQAAALTIPAPQYLKIEKPRKFFTKGRIFKTVWFEPFGEFSGSSRARPSELAYHESCPDYSGTGEKPYGRYRWFVVIRKQQQHSLCFAIVNGGVKSMAKNRARGEHLAVLYSTSVPPPEPDKEEGIVFGPLAVIMEEGKQNISPLARLDCSRVFTVEDDLKVMKIGRVHPDFYEKLDEYYRKTCFDEPVKSNGT
ncbi:hypothetical protein SMACR_06819 [Sordaria macrospora]|uniref:WGS project CABT00000000 data, contig 2.6 n=2 Tax=Sordaria macrospora TaxID=5147 RepID=F7VSP3_SORMK|nr:uncharacterized protein SMAC_06819 [Sordaria macrospora k-hell]KAA8630371.1 hypothetical protein SMACR_06819 [Sordaria macrospora]CCC08710.1 unnamed protein product [Sordaria macrospora k-hell]